ncbi:MAG: Rpn family recombination-promoting nuclease/putative transposase [Clostridium sp.]|nr:Rpn family recombination-promoting nuclease/putative transposase [Clostridium sp.]
MQQRKKTKKRKVQRQVKDRLFRFLFEKDKASLLQLYNALNGTDYQDASQLDVVTIESAVYVVMKNDLAFVFAGTLNLYEHQSTYNPNMPVRFLIYLAEEYQRIVEKAEASLYGTVRISLPTPQCIVFYNGEKEAPEEQILRLSDAFENKEKESDVELKVRMLNINYGYNRELMEKCCVLKEYAEFVGLTRHYIAEGQKMQDALNTAMSYCIDHGILSDFLRKYRMEVLGMLLEEFDVDKYERTLKNEGIEQGAKLERERIGKLTCILLEQNRIADLKRASEDFEYQQKLLKEFDILS